MKTLKSMLSFNDIYNYKEPCPNILKYNNSNIPCTCYFVERRFTIDCRVFLSKEIIDLIYYNSGIVINEVPFYIADYVVEDVDIGDCVIVRFTLISKEPFEIVQCDMI